MIRKTVLAALAGVALTQPITGSAADFGSGNLTFSATVTEAPCSISAGDGNMVVDLGQVSQNALNAPGKFSASVPIDIHLTGCTFAADTGAGANPNGKLSKVGVQFIGNFFNPTLGKLVNTGSAKSVSIQLLGSDNNTPLVGGLALTAANAQQLSGASAVLKYFARLSVLGGARAASTPGSISASVTYALTYF
ncbi:MAG: fimbrial protein [Achromobacter sp.]|uniref:fimbrial protein n=1 Tax=Achromobacter sp. TaxID=134375 RepID=UPI003CFF4B2E